MADFSQYDESEGWGVLLSQTEAGDNNQDAHRKDENGDLLLHYVLRKEATPEVVGALLEANPQAASVKDTNGLLPLHLALEKRAAPEIAEALLQAYPEAASEKDNDGRLPLHLASETQAAPKVVEALLRVYPDSAAVENNNGRIPLHRAAAKQAPLEVVEALLRANPEGVEKKSKFGLLALHMAAANKATPEVVGALLHANPQAASEKDNDGYLPLHWASAFQATPEVVGTLLQANPQASFEKDNSGFLPLHLALEKQAGPEVVEALLEANPQAASEKDEDGCLPLHLASESQVAPEVLRVLLQANPLAASVKNNNEHLPLQLALKKEAAPKVVEALLQANPQAASERDSNGCLPLHWASAFQAPLEVVEALLQANPQAASVADNDGDLPLHCASAKKAALGVVEALLRANPQATSVKDNGGDLPLHCALESNEATSEIVEVLLQANPKAGLEKDKYGNFPLHGKLTDEVALAALLQASPQLPFEKSSSAQTLMHLAAEDHSPLEVVESLLKANPKAASEKDGKGCLPLHLASMNEVTLEVLETLLHANPEAPSEKNSDGCLPLHLAAEDQAAPEVVELLLHANLQAALVKDNEGNFPLQHYLVERQVRHVEIFMKALFASNIDDLAVTEMWHGVVAVEEFVAVVAEAVGQHPRLESLKNFAGRSAYDNACGDCREAMDKALSFLGRYRIVGETHRSATALVLIAKDLKEDNAPEVALKLMEKRGQFLQETATRKEYGLDNKYVVAVLRAHVDASQEDAGGDVETMLQELGVELHVEAEYAQAATLREEVEKYRYCVVMEKADRDLNFAITHERFAGSDWAKIKSYCRDLLRALNHLHTRNLIHGDLKPLNAMRVGETWQLIDLDVSCRVGRGFGTKPPSSGYCPPEMARVLLSANGDHGKLEEYKADVAYDLWSFGTLLYFMASGMTLFQTDLNDNVKKSDLELLATWNVELLNGKLVESNIESNHEVVADLLRKLLDPDPAKRRTGGVGGILKDKFFSEEKQVVASVDEVVSKGFQSLGAKVDAVGTKMDGVGEKVQKVGDKVDAVGAKVDSLTQLVRAQARLMSVLLKKEREVPSLVCFVPVMPENTADDNGSRYGWWMRAAAKPKKWLNREVDLCFIDPVGLEVVKGHAFRLTFQREWVAKAMPYIKIGLTVLKTASAASRIAGFPVPDVAGAAEQFLGDQLAFMDELRDAAVEGLCDAVGGDKDAANDMMDTLDKLVGQAAEKAAAAVSPSDEAGALNDEAGKYLEASAAQLGKWLDTVSKDWKEQTGLVPAVCIDEGVKEWVLPRDKEAFEAQGSKILGSRARGRQQPEQQRAGTGRCPSPSGNSRASESSLAGSSGGAAEQQAQTRSATNDLSHARAGGSTTDVGHQVIQLQQWMQQQLEDLKVHQQRQQAELRQQQLEDLKVVQSQMQSHAEAQMRLLQMTLHQQPPASVTAAAGQAHPLAVPGRNHGSAADIAQSGSGVLHQARSSLPLAGLAWQGNGASKGSIAAGVTSQAAAQRVSPESITSDSAQAVSHQQPAASAGPRSSQPCSIQ